MMRLLVVHLCITFHLLSCSPPPVAEQRALIHTDTPAVLKQSWEKYVQHFIQEDGRVIDHKGGGISTSEGQSYAMLRAVWMGDRSTFDRAYQWGVNNLNSNVRSDSLWAWKWGKDAKGKWGVLDHAFAADADQDVALALILAWKTWNDPGYGHAAKRLLADLWTAGTVESGGRRFLLAGDTLCKGHACRVNPSYAAPYAYRIFAKFDTERDWNHLVDSSYDLLEASAQLTKTGLPPDWMVLDLTRGGMMRGDAKDSVFSYDALRVYWRVAMDRELFRDPRATRYLKRSLDWIIREWQLRQKLPAVISPSGESLADYESMEMLSALAPAMKSIKHDVADAMYRRLDSAYSAGVWGDPDSYYIQNWAWFGTALYTSYTVPFDRVRY